MSVSGSSLAAHPAADDRQVRFLIFCGLMVFLGEKGEKKEVGVVGGGVRWGVLFL